jgi:hypothetical protein
MIWVFPSCHICLVDKLCQAFSKLALLEQVGVGMGVHACFGLRPLKLWLWVSLLFSTIPLHLFIVH